MGPLLSPLLFEHYLHKKGYLSQRKEKILGTGRVLARGARHPIQAVQYTFGGLRFEGNLNPPKVYWTTRMGCRAPRSNTHPWPKFCPKGERECRDRKRLIADARLTSYIIRKLYLLEA